MVTLKTSRGKALTSIKILFVVLGSLKREGQCFNNKSFVILLSTAHFVVGGYEIVADVGGTVARISEGATRSVQLDLCRVGSGCVVRGVGVCGGVGSECVWCEGACYAWFIYMYV